MEEVVSSVINAMGTWLGMVLESEAQGIASHLLAHCLSLSSLAPIVPEGNVLLGLEGWARLPGWGWAMLPGAGVRSGKVG